MKDKILWVDTETTGLRPWVHDIHQLAVLVEIDGAIVEEILFKMQPIDMTTVEARALAVSNTEYDDLMTFENPLTAFQQFTALMDKYVKRTDKNDKFVFAGHNAPFDYEFVRHLFKKLGQTGFNQYLEYKTLDTYALAYMINYKIPLGTDNLKLETLCNRFDIPIEAHQALNDIQATRALFMELGEFIQIPTNNKPQMEGISVDSIHI